MIRPLEERQGEESGKVQRGEGAENGVEGEDLKEKNGMTSKLEEPAERWSSLKGGRQLGPARTEQLLWPISSSMRPRHSLA